MQFLAHSRGCQLALFLATRSPEVPVPCTLLAGSLPLLRATGAFPVRISQRATSLREGAAVLRRRAQPFTVEAQSGSRRFFCVQLLRCTELGPALSPGGERTEQACQAVSLGARAEVACPKGDATSNPWAHGKLRWELSKCLQC